MRVATLWFIGSRFPLQLYYNFYDVLVVIVQKKHPYVALEIKFYCLKLTVNENRRLFEPILDRKVMTFSKVEQVNKENRRTAFKVKLVVTMVRIFGDV